MDEICCVTALLMSCTYSYFLPFLAVLRRMGDYKGTVQASRVGEEELSPIFSQKLTHRLVDDIKRVVTQQLLSITEEAFQSCFQNLQHHWNRCITAEGDYFEGSFEANENMNETFFRNVTSIFARIAILYVAFLCFRTHADIRNRTYEWKSGSWDTCFSPSKCGEGQKDRKVWCVDSLGLIVPDSNCNSSSKPSTTDSCFRVCENHWRNLRWKVDHWTPCLASYSSHHLPHLNHPSKCSVTVGVTKRNVSCIFEPENSIIHGKRTVENSACEFFWDRPEDTMPCSMDCPQDCVIAQSEMTVNESDECGTNFTVKHVIVAPHSGGRSCSELTVFASNNNSLSSSCLRRRKTDKEFFLKVGAWSVCQPLDAINAQTYLIPVDSYNHFSNRIGLKHRNVTCVNSLGERVALRDCNSEKKVSPHREELCVVPRNCEVSPWSEWRVIKEGCINSEGHIFPELRTRKRRLQHISEGEDAKPCPPLWESALIVDDLPPCYKYKWVPSEWGECVVFEHPSVGHVKVLKPTCGGGVQQRSTTCLRVADLVPVDLDYCKEPPPVTVQRCTIPCKRDCQLSHWSKWGPCLPVNVTDYFQRIKSGFIKRERSIVVDPTPDGKPCGHLQEIDTCHDLEIFSWHYSKWSDCVLPNPQDACGVGKKTRDYTCVESKGEALSDFMCMHHATIAETTKSCTIPCPEDCVLSEWSEWSPCSKPCATGKAAHHKGGKTKNRTLLAIPGPTGKLCPELTTFANTCNEHSCSVIKWTTSQWEDCVFSGNSTCGDGGTQMRKVFCALGNDRFKSYKLCRGMPKPENERSCSVSCPMDCVLTKFSEWSYCPSSCDSDVIQTREQYVLREAKYGGKPCPSVLKEERPCSAKTELLCLKKKSKDLDSFRWNIGPWSDCILQFPGQQCGTGLQIRSVACLDDDDREVEFHHCLDNVTDTDTATYNIVDLISLVPKPSRQCDVLCGPICQVSEWSPWSHCGDSYNAHRTRTRELTGSSVATEICKASVPLEESQSCPPMPITVPKGDHFMSCIVSDVNRTLAAVNGQLQHICGSGFRYKAGFDMDQGFVLKPGLEKDICIVDCPVDCQMSEWSQWSPCNAPCGAGFRYRNRKVLIHANKLGRPCPFTENDTEVQTDACVIPCGDYQWSAGGWSECELFDSNSLLPCGNGTHYRTVKCIEKRSMEIVDQIRCDPQLRPPTSEPCQVFCPGECVVSLWSPWVDCSEPCNSESRRLRRRTVLRHPSSNSSHTCPPLVKEDPCVLNDTCFHHSWSLGEWSSCILEHGAVCGEGVQRRPVLCIRSDGRQVDHIMCEKRHQSPSLREPIAKPCYIDCPIDCILSSWSQWDESKCSSCGDLGVMTRYRTILQPPSEAGQPCSQDLVQRKPCSFRPCYHWKVTDWSSCDLKGADCGDGVRQREVRCERYDGLEVKKIHCLTVNLTFEMKTWIDPEWLTVSLDKQEEELCHVECPGDCILTQWSPWSDCNRDCTAGRAYGYRTSSRAVIDGPLSEEAEKCPDTLWRTRPCWDEYCYTFSWKILNDTIVCLRSDGLIVEGGCGDKPRPCSRPCGEQSVLCDAASGDCLCESGRTRLPLPGGAQGSSTNLIRCSMLNRMGHPQRPANHTAFTPEIRLMYFPDDSQASFWMYAMISIGTAFIIFVFVTVYLMCRSSIRRRMVSVQRQASVRRRGGQSPETIQSPCQC